MVETATWVSKRKLPLEQLARVRAFRRKGLDSAKNLSDGSRQKFEGKSGNYPNRGPNLRQQ